MNRETFMRELERLLYNIPENERKEALDEGATASNVAGIGATSTFGSQSL